MELKTVMLMLAVGSFIFGLLLMSFKFNKNNPYDVPFWITAKMLQAIGSLLLFFRTTTFDWLTVFATLVLLLGCAYETWTIRYLSGQTVKLLYHVLTSAGIILICLTTPLFSSPIRSGIIFLLHSIFYFLPSIFLFSKGGTRFSHRSMLAACYSIGGVVFLLSSIVSFGSSNYAINLWGSVVFDMIPVVSFCLFLISAFVLLMVAKERSDVQVVQIQKRFQQIVETAIEGIVIFDDNDNFKGSFAMLTDINVRKEMELLLEESNRRLRELSNQDGLTGIANRRCFDSTLKQEYSRLSRLNSRLSIILLDIDHFKYYNDYYGHVMGDECLRKIGGVLIESLGRSAGLAARYGGEEFACILPDTDLQAAVNIAEDIRQRIHDLKIEHKMSPISEFVTASFGVNTVKCSPEVTLEDIVAKTDDLLYEAKVSGRNMIEAANTE